MFGRKKKFILTASELEEKIQDRIKEFEYKANEKMCDLFIDSYIQRLLGNYFIEDRNDEKIGQYGIHVESNIIYYKNIKYGEQEKSYIYFTIYKVVNDEKNDFYRFSGFRSKAHRDLCHLRVTFKGNNPVIEASDIKYETMKDDKVKEIIKHIELVVKSLPIELSALIEFSDQDLVTYVHKYMFKYMSLAITKELSDILYEQKEDN